MTSFTTKRLGFFTRLLDDVPAGERYRLALAQIEAAEQHGYDTAWIAQHHFDPDEGGLPSPLVFLAHVAARTRTIRLGTGVITLPVEDPLRIAEDTAVLDLLSGGRLEIGLGTGGTPATFTAFGLAPEERGQVHAVKLAKLRNAWNGQEITDGRRLYPASPQLNNRVWQATFSVEGGRRAGLAGDGLMLSRTQPRPKDRPFLALDDIQNPIIDAYLEALPDGVEPRILASRSIFIADSRKEALRHAETGLRRVAKRFEASGHTLRGNSLEDLLAGLVLASIISARVTGGYAPVRVRLRDVPRLYLGGLLLGWGAMVSLGCTVGVLLSGIMAGAVSGWVFGLFCLTGAYAGWFLKGILPPLR